MRFTLLESRYQYEELAKLTGTELPGSNPAPRAVVLAGLDDASETTVLAAHQL
jgi:hypothetical protein